MRDLLADSSPITIKMKVPPMQVKQSFDTTDRHVWEHHARFAEDFDERDQDDEDDSSLLTGAASPRDVYENDEPMKLSTAAGSLW